MYDRVPDISILNFINVFSGMLLTVSMFKKMKKCTGIQSTVRMVLLMYLNRYLRLTPKNNNNNVK